MPQTFYDFENISAGPNEYIERFSDDGDNYLFKLVFYNYDQGTSDRWPDEEYNAWVRSLLFWIIQSPFLIIVVGAAAVICAVEVKYRIRQFKKRRRLRKTVDRVMANARLCNGCRPAFAFGSESTEDDQLMDPYYDEEEPREEYVRVEVRRLVIKTKRVETGRRASI